MPSEPRYKPASHVVEDDFKVGTVQACNRCGVSYIEGYTGDCQEQHCGGSVVSFGDPADVARKMEVAHAEGRAEALGEVDRAAKSLGSFNVYTFANGERGMEYGDEVGRHSTDLETFVDLTDDHGFTAALLSTEGER